MIKSRYRTVAVIVPPRTRKTSTHNTVGARLRLSLGSAGKFVPRGGRRRSGGSSFSMGGKRRGGSGFGKSCGGGSAQLCPQRLHLTVRPDAPMAAGSTTYLIEHSGQARIMTPETYYLLSLDTP